MRGKQSEDTFPAATNHSIQSCQCLGCFNHHARHGHLSIHRRGLGLERRQCRIHGAQLIDLIALVNDVFRIGSQCFLAEGRETDSRAWRHGREMLCRTCSPLAANLRISFSLRVFSLFKRFFSRSSSRLARRIARLFSCMISFGVLVWNNSFSLSIVAD